ncbi:MAG: hypothetical protein JSR76_02875 [Verrucomicrobia bacterium]|nr:hypothetical protein [Verrucomicrobiota bacterium]
MKKLLISALVFLSSALSAVTPAIDSDKLYLTPDELCLNYFDGFYIHLGNNVWVKTGTIHRDSGGIYFYDDGLPREWKCPYCYMYWPLGKACQNDQCNGKG